MDDMQCPNHSQVRRQTDAGGAVGRLFIFLCLLVLREFPLAVPILREPLWYLHHDADSQPCQSAAAAAAK